MAEKIQTQSRREASLQHRREFIRNCRNSRIIETLSFSETVMRIYKTRFRDISRSAYLTRFYCNNGQGGFDAEQKIIKEMSEMIKKINENIAKKNIIADQLIKKDNIKIGQAQYESVNCTIIDPIAKLFLNALNLACDLEDKLRALWLACELDDSQKRQALIEIEKEFSDVHLRCRVLMDGVKRRFYEQRKARDIAREASGETPAEEIAVSESEIIEEIEKDFDLEIGYSSDSERSVPTKKIDQRPLVTGEPITEENQAEALA